MDIYLTYRGQIPSKASSLDAVWNMRRSFHRQLETLWGKEPFAVLKKNGKIQISLQRHPIFYATSGTSYSSRSTERLSA
ncbi:hypothetical protein IQ26_02895 [Mesorhizobium tianshanense]|uniref:Uncharacterized protein n=1 Tax=Mesorhizobium tianshanense TaxID=39844 RepID=A0A562NVZ3_9HYPH|nr:hypothetical protein IQ26_02895 [Mesorhizobium tianshanense]